MDFRIFGRVIFISRPVIAILGVILLIAGAAGGYALLKEPEAAEIISMKTTAAVTSAVSSRPEAIASPAQTQDNNIHVYIVGCVKRPGLIKLKKGGLVYDAVNAAGGLTGEADRNNINMAYILTENVMLKILPVRKKVTQAPGAGPAGSGVIITGGIEAGVTSEPQPGGNKTPEKININTAAAEELTSLPGIGDAKARDIINFRTSQGPFRRVEDIMKVPGIKDARFSAIKDMICV